MIKVCLAAICWWLWNEHCVFVCRCRSQWTRGLRRRSSAARLLRSWFRIPPRAWMFVCCECCVLSGRGLCDGLITRPEKSYRLWRVVVCDQEASRMRRQKPATGLWKIQPQWVVTPRKQTTFVCWYFWNDVGLLWVSYRTYKNTVWEICKCFSTEPGGTYSSQ